MLQQLCWCLSTAAACACYTVLVVSRMHFAMQTVVQHVFSIVLEPDSAVLSVAYYSLKRSVKEVYRVFSSTLSSYHHG